MIEALDYAWLGVKKNSCTGSGQGWVSAPRILRGMLVLGIKAFSWPMAHSKHPTWGFRLVHTATVVTPNQKLRARLFHPTVWGSGFVLFDTRFWSQTAGGLIGP